VAIGNPAGAAVPATAVGDDGKEKNNPHSQTASAQTSQIVCNILDVSLFLY
jgi:hypothetical protein